MKKKVKSQKPVPALKIAHCKFSIFNFQSAGAAVLCALSVLCLTHSAPAQPARPITLAWTYTNSPPPDSFVLFSSTNLTTPLSNWTAIAQIACPIVATNIDANLMLTNYTLALVTNYSLTIAPGRMYFTLCASNIWGLSPFSNVIGLPPVPGNPLGLGVK
jgi:hypothetical protein